MSIVLKPSQLSLLVIQATPFCNINCKYCYLSDRLSKHVISTEILIQTFEKVLNSPLVSKDLTVAWHAGEPLAAPIRLYEDAIRIIEEVNRNKIRLHHSIQTNGMLINQKWCDFINKYKINIGISIDGPESLNDINRKTRSGKGTFNQTMKGVSYLRQNNIDFNVITVLSRTTLLYPVELHDFYLQNSIYNVGFNIEEIEGINASSSLESKDDSALKEFVFFVKTFLSLTKKSGIKVREFNYLMSLIEGSVSIEDKSQRDPFSILNIDCKGNFSTFSPELLDAKSELFGDFILGNIMEDNFESVVTSDKFSIINHEIQKGVMRCKETCSYFSLCGGGEPSNKFFENGSLSSTETLYCKLAKKILGDIIIEDYEKSLHLIEYINHA